MENKFIKLNFKYLNREDITFLQAGILSYLEGYQEKAKYCYKTEKELAKIFNTNYKTFSRSIIDLINKGLIFKSNDRKYLIPFQNRKVTILVDSNNPLPIAEVTHRQTITPTEDIYIAKPKEVDILNNHNKEKAIKKEKARIESNDRLDELRKSAPVPTIQLNENSRLNKYL